MQVVSIPYLYVKSWWNGLRDRRLFDDVETFCMFIGYPRSAHTLIGFLLDAHPHIVVASEINSLKYHRHGFSRRQIFGLLLENSRDVARSGRRHKRYSYEVPTGWSGRFEKLRIIGDKKGAKSTADLRKDLSLLQSFEERMRPVQLKLIHCMRNPYDNISTLNIRGNRPLQNNIDRYFTYCETVEGIKKTIDKTKIYDLRHENFVADPNGGLRDLCSFLGINGSDAYYDACAKIVYKSPHKSRSEVPWSPELIESVKERMSRFTYLQGYSYED